MRVQQLAPGLWYWTGRHPAWTPADGGPDGWAQEVGCVYYEAPGAVVLFDPLVPMEDPSRFYEALDRDVARAGLPVRVLLTYEGHRRSSRELVERYSGTVGERPGGVEIGAETLGETVYWVPEHGALVCGDLILGRAGGLRLPRAWIGEEHWEEALESLRPLLALPVERVLITHGEPVLVQAREALAAALGG